MGVIVGRGQYISVLLQVRTNLWSINVADTDPLLSQLEEVQSQLAFQEDALQSLNEALAQQQQEILLLRRQLELLKQRQDEAGATQGGSGDDGGEEKPPHY